MAAIAQQFTIKPSSLRQNFRLTNFPEKASNLHKQSP
jgi:hypothetical protein